MVLIWVYQCLVHIIKDYKALLIRKNVPFHTEMGYGWQSYSKSEAILKIQELKVVGWFYLEERSASILCSRCASWSSKRALTEWLLESQRSRVGTPVSLNAESSRQGCCGFLHVGLSPTYALSSVTSSGDASNFLYITGSALTQSKHRQKTTLINNLRNQSSTKP